jgi:hypothetical protein
LTSEVIATRTDVSGHTILGGCFQIFDKLPSQCVDVLILDPPYNLNKRFGNKAFSRVPVDEYTDWLRTLLKPVMRVLKHTATVYICGDWLSSASIFTAASGFFEIRSRITWEREKGRGAQTNWKNASEDIWFCTVSDDYTFNVDAVKLRRRAMDPPGSLQFRSALTPPGSKLGVTSERIAGNESAAGWRTAARVKETAFWFHPRIRASIIRWRYTALFQ